MQLIRPTGRVAGLIGHPVSGSLSPAMHKAAYEHLGLDWTYVPFDVTSDADAIAVLEAGVDLACVGFNITMPFKQVAYRACAEVSTGGSIAEAVNTVALREGRLIGHNTDGPGLVEALSEAVGFACEGRRVAIVGAGGAASGAAVAIAQAGALHVDFIVRDPSRATQLVSRLSDALGQTSFSATALTEARSVAEGADLIVNATPVGMNDEDAAPIPASWLRPDHVVFDMVYGTREPTDFVAAARALGCVALDGLEMLVRQGAIALDIWLAEAGYNKAAPREIMRQAALHELDVRARG